MTMLDAAARLTSSLATVAAALAAADTDGLLAAEEGLASALAGMSVGPVTPHERDLLARELAHTRANLARCRVLGRSACDATHSSLVALGRRLGEYRPGGEETSDPTDVAARGFAVERSM
jgi:hypothetical protein